MAAKGKSKRTDAGTARRTVRSGLIQMSNALNDENASVEEVRDAMLKKHLPMIEEAGRKGVQILCLQEIFNGPYFCPSQDASCCDIAVAVPGTTVDLMQTIATMNAYVIIVQITLHSIDVVPF